MWTLEGNNLKNKAKKWTSTDEWKLPDPETVDCIENTSNSTFVVISNDEIEHRPTLKWNPVLVSEIPNEELALLQKKTEKFAKIWKEKTGTSKAAKWRRIIRFLPLCTL